MNHRDILTWLGYMVVSPIAVLVMAAFLLAACAPVDTCPDLRCEEYGYGEAPTEAPAPSPEPEKGDDKGGKGKGHDKGDKGEDGDDD